MQLKCSVTSSFCHLLFGNNLLTSPWLRHRALSSGPGSGSGRAAVPSAPCGGCCLQLSTFAPAPRAPTAPRASLCSCAELPLSSSVARLSGSLRSFSAVLLPGHHPCSTTDLHETHRMNSVVPARHRQRFSAGERRQGGSRNHPSIEQVSTHQCLINKERISQVICLPGRSQNSTMSFICLRVSSGTRMSRLPGCPSYKNHHQGS